MSRSAAKFAMDDKDRDRLTKLAIRAAQGDRKAFDDFWNDLEWQKKMDEICRWIWLRFPSPDGNGKRDAEDLKQRASERAIRKLSKFNGTASVSTWFEKLALNVNRREFSREIRHGECLSNYWGAKHDLSDEDPYTKAALNEAYRKLEPKEQEIYKLLLLGKSPMDIAQYLNELVWSSLSKGDREKERKRVYKIIEKIQGALIEAVEVR
ncbi:MAG TPA: hypothetical protein VKB86_15715 [Pyrinomonadaceae bacterium]|nr:hypothetical protein [Pyrinomonadaceae bacterium]